MWVFKKNLKKNLNPLSGKYLISEGKNIFLQK
jgi:hypothetical protein